MLLEIGKYGSLYTPLLYLSKIILGYCSLVLLYLWILHNALCYMQATGGHDALLHMQIEVIFSIA